MNSLAKKEHGSVLVTRVNRPGLPRCYILCTL
jgi:hypothetical protein